MPTDDKSNYSGNQKKPMDNDNEFNSKKKQKDQKKEQKPNVEKQQKREF